jgi:hypothetical protein
MAAPRLVDTLGALEEMLAAVESVERLAVDAEGCSLGRHGKLCLLAVHDPGPAGATWLVDVTELGEEAFDHAWHTPSLRDVLEDPDITKVRQRGGWSGAALCGRAGGCHGCLPAGAAPVGQRHPIAKDNA